MDTSLIYQALEQPSLRKQIPLDELERIQAAYPYFTAAQVLLAKIYQENKDHRYADQLQQAALYAIDRKVLSEYMKGNEEVGKWENGETGKRENEEVGLSTGSRTGGNGEETIQNDNQKQNENELRGENEIEVKNEPVRQAQGHIQNENELRGESEEEIHEEEKSDRLEMSDFDREILIEAVQSSIELEVGEENEEEGLSTGSRTGENGKTEEIERIKAKDPSELTFGELMMLKAARMGLSTSSGTAHSTSSGTYSE